MRRSTTKPRAHPLSVYRSSIPAKAKERIVSRHANGSKECADYFLNRRTVGRRYWYENGQLDREWSLRSDGVRHGYEYEFAPNGRLTFKSRHVNGREHGTARQWNDKGQLLVMYTKRHGVGLDLWCDNISGKLCEERYYPDDNQLGYERWWTHGRAIRREAYWLAGWGWHGIEREWNAAGRLTRGFPKYFVRDARITKREYIRATTIDPRLPKYISADDRPYRRLPESFVRQRAQSSS